jgi:hypothetical protein
MMFVVVVDNGVEVDVCVEALDPIDSVVAELMFDSINYRYVYV